MPILTLEGMTEHEGGAGFVLEYSGAGINQDAVAGRARGRTAASFPIKAGSLRIDYIRQTGRDRARGLDEYEVGVYVPYTSRIQEMTTEQISRALENIRN